MRRIVVDLPALFGPRKPVTTPRSDGEGEMVDDDLAVVALAEIADLDHVRRPDRLAHERIDSARAGDGSRAAMVEVGCCMGFALAGDVATDPFRSDNDDHLQDGSLDRNQNTASR